MNCDKILDNVYKYSNEDTNHAMPLYIRMSIGLHLLICPDCAQEVERFEVCRDMSMTVWEDTAVAMTASGKDNVPAAEDAELSCCVSTRGWIIAGLVMLVSLATAFFGLDFNKVAVTMGMSFMLPIGITIGMVLTCYGAIFIGSHLKELSERFGL